MPGHCKAAVSRARLCSKALEHTIARDRVELHWRSIVLVPGKKLSWSCHTKLHFLSDWTCSWILINLKLPYNVEIPQVYRCQCAFCWTVPEWIKDTPLGAFKLFISVLIKFLELLNPLPLLFKTLLQGQKDRIFFSGHLLYILQQVHFRAFRPAQDI
jgi:hypothetical protein